MSLVSIVVLVSCLLAAGVLGTRYYEPLEVSSGKPLESIPEGYRQYACTYDNVAYYEHGELYRINYQSRCVTYRCEAGTPNIFREGCLDDVTQKCVPVGHSWTMYCHAFVCHKSVEGDFYVYEGIRNQITCYDRLTGTCKRNGETFRSYDKNNRLREKCTCRIVAGSSADIQCMD